MVFSYFTGSRTTHGFSLVELSIVLVILGLLTGGILTGQSLIRAAELRSVTTDLQRYMTALRAFQDRYMALPGDMQKATDFWGTASACPNGAGTGSQTCNGDGNGQFKNSAGVYHEPVRGWQHLANAGLIEGAFTGTHAASAPYMTLGGNIPAARLGKAGFSFGYASEGTYGVWKTQHTSNLIFFGTLDGGADATRKAALTPEEAWNIDMKLDDGIPYSGFAVGEHASASACYTATPPADADYQLSSTSVSCSFRFLLH